MKNFQIGQPLELTKIDRESNPKAVITYKNGEALKYAVVEDSVKKGSKALVTSGAVYDFVKKNSGSGVASNSSSTATVLISGSQWSTSSSNILHPTNYSILNVVIGDNKGVTVATAQGRSLSIVAPYSSLGSSSALNLAGYAPLTGGWGGEILFINKSGTALAQRLANIFAYNDGSLKGGGLGFSVVSNSTTTGAFTVAMNIANTGNIGMGTSSPQDKLHLYGGGNLGLRIETSTEGAGGWAVIRFRSPVSGVSTEQGYLGFDDENNQFVWNSSSGKNWLFDGVGEVRVPNLRITATPTDGENYQILLREPTFGTVYKAVIGANMTLAGGILNSKGSVDYFGNPLANQIAFWYDGDTIQGDVKLTYSANKLQVNAGSGTGNSWLAGLEVTTISSTVGDSVFHSVEKTATSGAGSAYFNAHVDDGISGDAYIHFGIIGTRYYAFGIDNTDDILKWTTGTTAVTPSNTVLASLTSAGLFTVGNVRINATSIDGMSWVNDTNTHISRSAEDVIRFTAGGTATLLIGLGTATFTGTLTMSTGNIIMNNNSITGANAITANEVNINSTGAGFPRLFFQEAGSDRARIHYDETENRFEIAVDDLGTLADAFYIDGTTKNVSIVNDLTIGAKQYFTVIPDEYSSGGAYLLLRNFTTGAVERVSIGYGLTIDTGALKLSETYVKLTGGTPPVANQVAFWETDDTIKGDANLTWATNKLIAKHSSGTGNSWLAGLEVTTISSTVGDSVFHSVEKTATSGTGSAYFNAYVNPAVSGDAFIRFGVLNTRYYVVGIDNTDDVFRIDTGTVATTVLTTAPLLSLNSAGDLTLKTSATFTTGQFQFSGSRIDFLDDADSYLNKTADTFAFVTASTSRLTIGNTGVTVATGLIMSGNADITLGSGNLDMNGGNILNLNDLTATEFIANTTGVAHPTVKFQDSGTTKGFIRYHKNNNTLDIGADSTSVLLDGTHDAIRISGANRDVRIINDLEVATTLRLEATAQNTEGNGYILVRNMGVTNPDHIEHLTIGTNLSIAGGVLSASGGGNANTTGSGLAGRIAYFTNDTTITGDTKLTWNLDKLQNAGTNVTTYMEGGRFLVTATDAEANAILRAVHTAVTGSGYSALELNNADGGGDTYVFWSITSAINSFSAGIDNSDSNTFKFRSSTGATLSDPSTGTLVWRVASGGGTLFANNLGIDTLPTDAVAGHHILLRNNSTGAVTKLAIGAGLSISGTDLIATSGSGTVNTNGTPVAGQVAYFFGATTIQGSANFTYTSGTLTLTAPSTATVIDASKTSGTGSTVIFSNTSGAGTSYTSGAIQASFIGNANALKIRNHTAGDYFLYNDLQNNGIAFNNSTLGVRIVYNGSSTLLVDSNNVTVLSSGRGLTINSTNSNAYKIELSDNGAIRGYWGATASYPIYIANGSAVMRLALVDSSSVGLIINDGVSGNPHISFRQDNTERAYIQYGDSDDTLNYVNTLNAHIFQSNGGDEIIRMQGNGSTDNPYISFYQVAGGVRRAYMQYVNANGAVRLANDGTGGFDMYCNGSLRYLFDNSGNFHADANITGYSTSVSDRRLKKNIVSIDSKDALNSVLKMRGVHFEWKHKDDGGHYGFIAQEMQKIYEDIVVPLELPFVKEGTYNTIRQTELIPVLVEAIKEQNKEINELKIKLKQLTN